MRRIFIAAVSFPSWLLIASGCSTSNSAPNPTTDGSADSTIVFLDAGPSTPTSPDGGPSCPAGCNYQTQQGCASGQMCHPQLSGDTVSPLCQTAGTKTLGESCAWLECQAGLFCASDLHCRHMCCGGDWSVCADNESCTGAIQLQAAGASSPVPANVSVCEPIDNCDVLNPNSCPAGKSCYVVDSRAGVRCLPTGVVQFGGACTSAKLCEPGLTCVQSVDGRSSNCRRLCRAVVGGGEPGCPIAEGGYCSHFVRDPPEVGECTPTI